MLQVAGVLSFAGSRSVARPVGRATASRGAITLLRFAEERMVSITVAAGDNAALLAA
jgi:hypothetical protein